MSGLAAYMSVPAGLDEFRLRRIDEQPFGL